MIEPQQALFGYILTELKEMGYSVFDGELPKDETTYPFIYLADSQTVDEARKDAVQGTVYQTIHVWHDKVRERGTVSAIIYDIKTLCRKLENESGWLLSECSSRILADNSTGRTLMHGIIETGFKF